MNLVLVPHSMEYAGARRIAEALTEKVGHRVWRVKPDRIGQRIAFVFPRGTSKLTQYQKFKENGIDCPDFTEDKAEARQWVAAGDVVVCRGYLRGYDGHGITVAASEAELVDAPLYTRYVKKKQEFRVNVLNGEVISVHERRRRRDATATDTRIRNSANGYVFCRDGFEEPEGIRDLAIKAAAAIGYGLGGVDIGYNHHYNRLFVLEVNAAPDVGKTDADAIANGIQKMYNERLKLIL